MRQTAWILGLAICAGGVTGCVERRYVITTDPPGAVVLRNGAPIGASPADDHFVYYGKYKFTIIKDGYETKHVVQPIETPWYEFFPLDFFTENLVPWRIEDVRRFHYQLEPIKPMTPEEIVGRAGGMREQGKAVHSPNEKIPIVHPPPQPMAPPIMGPAPGVVYPTQPPANVNPNPAPVPAPGSIYPVQPPAPTNVNPTPAPGTIYPVQPPAATPVPGTIYPIQPPAPVGVAPTQPGAPGR